MKFEEGDKVRAIKGGGGLYLSGDTGIIETTPGPGVECYEVQFDNNPPRQSDGLWFVSEDEVELVKSVEAVKHDAGKPPMSYLSLELMEEVAKVREFGAKKYSANGWKKGFKMNRSLDAALRHIFLFKDRSTLDDESGLTHLGHAICCLEHALYDLVHHPENDDRPESARKDWNV